MKRGFTLIELLVVVLIIGILAAVALPQYRVAVERTRLATVQSNVSAAVKAVELYYLANGEYPDTFEDMGFEVSGCTNDTVPEGEAKQRCPNTYYHYVKSDGRVHGVIRWNSSVYSIVYTRWPHSLRAECWARSGNNVAIQACQSMGGVYKNTDGDGWKRFSLE